MTRTFFQRIVFIVFATISLIAHSWPEGVATSASYNNDSVQLILVTASLMDFETDKILEPKMDALRGANLSESVSLTESQNASLSDLKTSYGKLEKVKSSFARFENFYYRTHPTYMGSDRLSPLEMTRIIDHLVLLEKYFKKLQSRKFIAKILVPHQIEALEILSLKNKMLIQRLSLDINNVAREYSNKPAEFKALFNGVDWTKVVPSEIALDELTRLIPRIARLESEKFKICLALF